VKAVVIRAAGGPEALELSEWPSPTVGAGQVRVAVRGCGVCYRDVIDRQGKYPFMRRPVVTGHEWAGEIVEVGAGVVGFAVGDRVASVHRPACGECPACLAGDEIRCGSPVMYGLTVDGGYAEEVLAWVGSLVKVPAAVPLDEAAVLHCTAAVALRALRHHARLVAGETVLITGASGGVGVYAIQVAKILGARVLAVTSQEAKVAALKALGVDEVIVAAGEFHKGLSGAADVALELVGAPTFNSALRTLRPGGRVVIVGNVTGERLEVNPGYLILKELSVAGSSSATRAELGEVLGWAADGRLRPVIAARLPLGDAALAQRRLETRAVVGRQVLIP